MKTLYDRLTDDMRLALEEKAEKYESINDYLIPRLKQVNDYYSLNLYDLSSLCTFGAFDSFSLDYMDLMYGRNFFKDEEWD